MLRQAEYNPVKPSGSAGGDKPQPEPEGSTLLVFILDILATEIRENTDLFSNCVDSVVTLCKLHLANSQKNKLAVMFRYNHAGGFLYPIPADQLNASTTKYEEGIFTQVGAAVNKGMEALRDNPPGDTGAVGPPTGYLETGVIGKALCYAQRMIRENAYQSKLRTRILLVTGNADCNATYLPYQPVFLTAQKLGVQLDVVSIFNESRVLQHGCELTGGQYIFLPNVENFFQRLLTVFFLHDHRKLNKMPAIKLEHGAACVCHQELVNTGFVCASCLAIFCQPENMCSICRTVFQDLNN